MFTFVIVIRQNFKDNKNFRQFSRKNSKIYGFCPYVSKKLQFFFGVFNKDCTFYTKNLVFATKDAQSIVKIRFLVTFFTFLSVIRQNFEYNLRILTIFA